MSHREVALFVKEIIVGWIHITKSLLPDKKRWYCSMCDKRTPIELNPEWVADGKPSKWDESKRYEWFSRCSYCHFHYWHSQYDCPNCGCDCSEEEPLQTTKPVYNSYYSYEFGVTGYDWEEQHQCRKCRTKYWFSNSNC